MRLVQTVQNRGGRPPQVFLLFSSFSDAMVGVRGGSVAAAVLALVASQCAVDAQSMMGNCSYGISTNDTVCKTSAHMQASCLSVEYYSVIKPRFCHMIGHPVFISKGGADLKSFQDLDDFARAQFITSPVGRYEKCCRETYRAFLCAEIFPRCAVNSKGLVSRWPTCRSWRCNSFQKRSDVEKRVAGFVGRPCFSETENGGPECLHSDAYPEMDFDKQVDCTCPIPNVTTGKECVPFKWRVTWEDIANDRGKGMVDACDDVSAITANGSAAALGAPASLLAAVAAAALWLSSLFSQ